MTKLFTASKEASDDAASSSAGNPAGGESPGRSLSGGGAGQQQGDARRRLTLLGILHEAVRLSSAGQLFDQNMREVVEIEDKAATTYVGIKSKELRTTVFAGYALLIHNELCGAWQPLATGGVGGLGGARIPVHLSRVLLTLCNEKRQLAEALAGMFVLRGENGGSGGGVNAATNNGEEETKGNDGGAKSGASTPSGGGGGGGASRSLFGGVDDSGSDSDEGPEDGGGVARGTSKRSMKRAFCEQLQYKDHLYRQLCVGLLQVYQDLILRLRTNKFYDSGNLLQQQALSNTSSGSGASGANSVAKFGNVAGGALKRPPPSRRAQVISTIREGGNEDGDGDCSDGEGVRGAAAASTEVATRMPYALGQALEEYKYLKVITIPNSRTTVYPLQSIII